MTRSILLASLLALPSLLVACEEDEADVPRGVCSPVIDQMEPASGPTSGGTQVTLSGLFVATEVGERDVAVHVGGVRAETTGVFRGNGCANCDACAASALRCEECERVCRGLSGWTDPETEEYSEAEVCEEWVSFVVPASEEDGEAEVVLTNSHGATIGPVYTYVSGGDDDSADGG